jgi:lysozyme family protein
MSNFDVAVAYLIENETGGRADGGLTTDQGGLTKWGISQKAYPDLDIKNLTRENAVALYRKDYWLFDAVKSDRIATKLLDLYANMEHNGIKCVQWALGYLTAGPVIADGIWGPN